MMDWSPQPLAIVLYAVGFLGIIVFTSGLANVTSAGMSNMKWLIAADVFSLLVVVAAAVLHGFIA